MKFSEMGSPSMIERVGVLFGLLVLILLFGAAPVSAELEPTLSEAQREASVESWDRLGVDRPRRYARAELAVGQLYHGLFFGLQACSLFDCDQPLAHSGLPVLGGGIGLGGSFLVARDGITTGQARAINSGSIWGAWTGFALMGVRGDYGGTTVVRTMMATQLLGTGAGYLLSERLRPTGGDVRMVNLAGFWSGIYYVVFAEGILQLNQSDRSLGTGLLVSTYLGAILGSQIALYRPMSASRVALIALSGFVGAHVGSALAYSRGDGEYPDSAMNDRATASMTLVGITAGLGAGAILTRNFDRGEPAYERVSISLSVLPSHDGTGALATLSGQF